MLLIVIILDFSVLSIAQAHLRAKEERERVADLKEEEEEERKKGLTYILLFKDGDLLSSHVLLSEDLFSLLPCSGLSGS